GRSLGAYRKILMKTGLVLIVLGHISFIAGALVHGMVLRYMMDTHDAVTLQYSISNILAVTSALLGQSLLATCSFSSPELAQFSPDCPFDPTRIYSSTLCLWGISLVLEVAESIFSVRCAQLIHQLLELKPWWGKSSTRMVGDSPELSEGRDLLSCSSSEPLAL
uniref:Transmembrane protein 54 n=1 Tax=Ornithorhynchus anatinus TaxID=9258 RepID=F6WXK6_ORNAN